MTRLLLALAALSGACEWSCGGQTQEAQVAVYASAEQACVLQATSYDAGLACVQAVQRAFCGPGGVFAEAGICPEAGQ